MRIIIGTFYSGTTEKLNDQSIKSKFFILGIPLFPISSFYFVNKNQGIALPLQRRSALIGLGRTLCPIIGITLTLLSLMYDDFPDTATKVLAILGAIAFVGLSVYAWATGHTIPDEERKARLLLEKAIGYNMLPSKLPRDTRITILQSVLQKLDNKFSAFFVQPGSPVDDFDNTELPVLYALSTYMLSIKENKAASAFLEQYPAEKVYAASLVQKAHAV